MLNPKAVHLIIKYFDGIDSAVSARTARKRPWSEISLTSLLCDLLDEETQSSENLSYTLPDLNRDLQALDGLLDVSLVIETHEYPPAIERFVTQSDLGLIIEFADHLLPDQSWSAAWLLQAKRLFPDKRSDSQYTEASRFGSISGAQQKRMEQLQQLIGFPFVRYLLYCPRPSVLDEITRAKLSHLRNRRLGNHIFDYTIGLELYQELTNSTSSSLEAGVFIADLGRLPRTFGAVHGSILETTHPFSWFLASHLTRHSPWGFQDRDPGRPGRRLQGRVPDEPFEWARGIVKGDPAAVAKVINAAGEGADQSFVFVPPHTLTVRVSVGAHMNPNTRHIRNE